MVQPSQYCITIKLITSVNRIISAADHARLARRLFPEPHLFHAHPKWGYYNVTAVTQRAAAAFSS